MSIQMQSHGRRGVPTGALLLLPAALLLAIGFAYPLVEIVRSSLSDGVAAFSWVAESTANRRVLIRTFEVSAIVTLVDLTIGYPLAYLLVHAPKRLGQILMITVLIPLWTSTMIRTFSWVTILQNDGPLSQLTAALGLGESALLGSTTAVVIGMSQVLLPFIVLPMYAVMVRIDPKLTMAAKSLGARPVVAFLRVHLPLSLPGVYAGSLLVFILALGFYITPALLGSPSNAMVSTLITAQAQQLLDFPRASALSVVLVVLTLVVLVLAGLAQWLVSRRGRGRR